MRGAGCGLLPWRALTLTSHHTSDALLCSIQVLAAPGTMDVVAAAAWAGGLLRQRAAGGWPRRRRPRCVRVCVHGGTSACGRGTVWRRGPLRLAIAAADDGAAGCVRACVCVSQGWPWWGPCSSRWWWPWRRRCSVCAWISGHLTRPNTLNRCWTCLFHPPGRAGRRSTLGFCLGFRCVCRWAAARCRPGCPCPYIAAAVASGRLGGDVVLPSCPPLTPGINSTLTQAKLGPGRCSAPAATSVPAPWPRYVSDAQGLEARCLPGAVGLRLGQPPLAHTPSWSVATCKRTHFPLLLTTPGAAGRLRRRRPPGIRLGKGKWVG